MSPAGARAAGRTLNGTGATSTEPFANYHAAIPDRRDEMVAPAGWSKMKYTQSAKLKWVIDLCTRVTSSAILQRRQGRYRSPVGLDPPPAELRQVRTIATRRRTCSARPPRRQFRRPGRCVRLVTRNTLTHLVRAAKRALPDGISLLGRLSEPSDGFCVIASNALTGIIHCPRPGLTIVEHRCLQVVIDVLPKEILLLRLSSWSEGPRSC